MPPRLDADRDAPRHTQGLAARLGDLSGAFADLGTFLPLVLGVFAVQNVDPTGLLVGFGVFALAVISSRLLKRKSFGVGLYLAWAGLKLILQQPWLGVAALLLLLVLQPTRFRPLAALTVIAAAAVWGSSQSPGSMPALEIAWRLPGFELPGTGAFWESLRDVLLPQLALTLTNATVITAAIAADYFPDDRARITPDRLAMSTGVMNLLLAPLGAFPMCHGAGGLVVQHRFGARTGLAPAIFGMACLVSGLLLGEQALALLALLPMAAIGALLLVAGFNLAISKPLRRASPDRLFVIGLIGISCVLMNVAMGLLVGIVLEWLRVRLVVGDTRA